MSKKPTVLMILDGYGLNERHDANAVYEANTPVMDKLMAEYPFVKGNASGLAVGLPDGQMGNSEVGHMNMGAGRTELAMSIFGKSYGTKISGQVFINGKEVKLNTVQEAIDNKLAYVTEDRKGNGLILSKSIKMNTSLANMKGISNGKVIDADKEYAIAEEYRKKLKTKCPSVEQNVGNLSGGNQQKVLLAKWMFAEPDILILDEPTRGIDVGAKYEIYCIINDLVAAGKSVIMISSELPEVLGMSDRIYIMNEGRFVGEVGKEEATSELIMSKIVKSGKGA